MTTLIFTTYQVSDFTIADVIGVAVIFSLFIGLLVHTAAKAKTEKQ